MSSTNKTTYYELSQYVGSDKPTYLGDYNSDMLKIDTAIHTAADNANTALTTANSASSAAATASTTASTALSTAQTASDTATQAQTTAETALTNSGAAQSVAEEAETAARANVITNLAPAYDSTLTYDVDDLVTYIDNQGSGKLYKCVVAVTTPEAFNINKWDDVTTSEVYKQTNTLVFSMDLTSTTTWSDFTAAVTSSAPFTLTNDYLLKITTPTYENIVRARAVFSASSVVFVDTIPGTGQMAFLYINTLNSTGVSSIVVNSNGVTNTDINSNAISATGGKIEIFKCN